MQKTVVITPYQKEVSGTLEHERQFDDIVIRIRLNHPVYQNEDILRLYALSTAHAARRPYLADIFDVQSQLLCARIKPDAVPAIGYALDDIDTYIITVYNQQNETAIAGAFLGLEWCAARFLNTTATTDCDEPKPDTPLENAKILLETHKGAGATQSRIQAIVKSFETAVADFEQLSLAGGDSYIWYRINGDTQLSAPSAVRHILSGNAALSAIRVAGHYIAGICKDDNRHIAIGVPACRYNCPVPQVADCCVFADGYHIAGIFLANDGQYFEKCLQNVQI